MGGIEVVRLAAGDDMAAVARVYARSWRHAYRGIVPQSYLDSLSEGFWQLGLEQSADRTFIAREGSEIVGVCTHGPARVEAFAGWGEIVSLYVLPERVGRGIGSKLLYAALGALAAEGFEPQDHLALGEGSSCSSAGTSSRSRASSCARPAMRSRSAEPLFPPKGNTCL